MVEDLGKGMGDVALAVISECCFGRRLEDSVEPGRGYVMSYREALDTAIENILAIITLPSWVLSEICRPLRPAQQRYDTNRH